MNKTPTHTKTGKPRLGGMGIVQLQTLLKTSSKPKDRAKITKALARREKTQTPKKNIGVDSN